VLDRAAGEHQLSPDARIVATGNYAKDSAATFPMPTPLRTRFVHLNIQPGLAAFKSWLVGHEADFPTLNFKAYEHHRACPEMVAYWDWRGAHRAQEDRDGLLYAFDERAQTFACPRTYAMASALIDAWRDEPAVTDSIKHELLIGTLGQGAATELVGFLKLMNDALPSLDAIIKKPDTAKISTDISVRYAVFAALLGRLNEETADAIFTYYHRMGLEFCTTALLISARRRMNIKHSEIIDKFNLWKVFQSNWKTE